MCLSYPYFYKGHAYHLYVFDISNFSSSIPPPIIDYTGGMHVSGIVVLGNYIYVAWGEDGLVILKME
ncbi:MAG TPA: hypothetical protein EYP60_01145 [bacterium (Candidatus Stahlbacteria)]|nr:hypothetical protein [Candidatus Stahlbacteria bacterium]